MLPFSNPPRGSGDSHPCFVETAGGLLRKFGPAISDLLAHRDQDPATRTANFLPATHRFGRPIGTTRSGTSAGGSSSDRARSGSDQVTAVDSHAAIARKNGRSSPVSAPARRFARSSVKQ